MADELDEKEVGTRGSRRVRVRFEDGDDGFSDMDSEEMEELVA